jgi:hypothetical protein
MKNKTESLVFRRLQYFGFFRIFCGFFLICNFGMLTVFSSVALSVQPKTTTIQVDNSDGLVRIDENGAYIYDEKRTLKDTSSHFRFGQANQPELSLVIDGQEFKFEDFYGSPSGVTVGYDYEQFFARGAGRLGWQVGVAIQYAQGKGRLIQSPAPSLESRESFTFLTTPLYVGAVYRFEFKDRQIAVPYAAGGGVAIGLLEKREDKSSPDMTSGFGFYGAGGVLLNISAFDRETALTLDSEYGVGNLWLNLEFKVVNASGSIFKYENAYVQGGISFDY